MINTCIVRGFDYVGVSYVVSVDFIDNADLNSADHEFIDIDMSSVTDAVTLQAAAQVAIDSYIVGAGYTITNSVWPFAVTNPPIGSALSLSLQTSTGAVGTQVSTTRNSYVMLNGLVSTTATIGGASAGDIILEVAPTNSATAGDWIEWGRIGNSQTITLAIALNSIQVTKGMSVAFVPKGYYVKARQAGSGTVSYTLTNAKKILI